ncbi:MAG: hypothetical protein ACRC5A_02085 [Enterobacteriaceae bacterium]
MTSSLAETQVPPQSENSEPRIHAPVTLPGRLPPLETTRPPGETAPPRHPAVTLPGRLPPAEPPQNKGDDKQEGSTLPARPVYLSSSLDLVMIEDLVANNRYITTLGSSTPITGASAPALYGTQHRGGGNQYPVAWYPHLGLKDVVKITTLEPASAFRGLTDGRGSVNETTLTSQRFSSPEESNLLLSDAALQHFIGMSAGSSETFLLDEELENGSQRHLMAQVHKKGRITLQRPAQFVCHDQTVQGIAGKACLLREVTKDLALLPTNDIYFVLHSRIDSKGLFYRTGGDWHPLSTPSPLAELTEGSGVELFIASERFQHLGDYQRSIAGVPFNSLFKAGFYSASRYQRGDRFALALGNNQLPNGESAYRMSRLQLLQVNDRETGRQYITTLNGSADRNGQVAVYGTQNPRSGERGLAWYFSSGEVPASATPVVTPEEILSNGSGVTHQEGETRIAITPAGWQKLSAMAIGDSQHWRYEQTENAIRSLVIAHVIKDAELTMDKPHNNQCRDSEVEGRQGVLCRLRDITLQGNLVQGSSLRFQVRGELASEWVRYRVGKAWEELNTSIPVSDFADSQGIDLFLVLPENDTQSRQQQLAELPLKLSGLQLLFLAPERFNKGDKFTMGGHSPMFKPPQFSRRESQETALQIEQLSLRQSQLNPGDKVELQLDLNRLAKNTEKLYLRLESTSSTPSIDQMLALADSQWQEQPVTLQTQGWSTLPLPQANKRQGLKLIIPVSKSAPKGELTLTVSTQAPGTETGGTDSNKHLPATQPLSGHENTTSGNASTIKQVQVTINAAPVKLSPRAEGDRNELGIMHSFTIMDHRIDLTFTVNLKYPYFLIDHKYGNTIGFIALSNCLANHITTQNAKFIYKVVGSSEEKEINNIKFTGSTSDGIYRLDTSGIAKNSKLTYYRLILPKNSSIVTPTQSDCTIKAGLERRDEGVDARVVNVEIAGGYLINPLPERRAYIESSQTLQLQYPLRRPTNASDSFKMEFNLWVLGGIGELEGAVAASKEDIIWSGIRLNGKPISGLSDFDKEVNNIKVAQGTTKLELSIPTRQILTGKPHRFLLMIGENNKGAFTNPVVQIDIQKMATISAIEAPQILGGSKAQFTLQLDRTPHPGQQLRLQFDPIDTDSSDIQPEKATLAWNDGSETPLPLPAGKSVLVTPPGQARTATLRMPTHRRTPAIQKPLAFQLRAQMTETPAGETISEGKIHPLVTLATWRKTTQDAEKLEILAIPQSPQLAERLLTMQIAPSGFLPGEEARLEQVDIKGATESSLDLSGQRSGTLTLTAPPQEVSLTIPLRPIYHYGEPRMLKLKNLAADGSVGEAYDTQILPQPLPLKTVQGSIAPPGRALYFTITPNISSAAAASLFIKATGDSIGAIDWDNARFMQDIPGATGEATGYLDWGRVFHILHPFSGNFLVKLPVKPTFDKPSGQITLHVNGGDRFDEKIAVTGSGTIDKTVFYVDQVTAEAASRGKEVRIDIRLGRPGKPGDKIFIRPEFPDADVTAADLDLQQARLVRKRGSLTLPLSEQGSVYTIDSTDAGETTFQLWIPVKKPAQGINLKGGVFQLAVSGGSTFSPSLGEKVQVQIDSVPNSFSLSRDDGGSGPVLLQGLIGSAKPLTAALRVDWKIGEGSQSTLSERIQNRNFSGRTGLKLLITQQEKPSPSSHCLMKISEGAQANEAVILPLFVDLPVGSGWQSKEHDCTTTPILLDNLHWQVLSRTDTSAHLQLPFKLTFPLDSPLSQQTLQGQKWFGAATINGSVTVRSQWQ